MYKNHLISLLCVFTGKSCVYNISQCLRVIGSKKRATAIYEKILQSNSGTSIPKSLSKHYVISIIDNLRLSGYSNYAAHSMGDSLFFVSNRPTRSFTKKIDSWTVSLLRMFIMV